MLITNVRPTESMTFCLPFEHTRNKTVTLVESDDELTGVEEYYVNSERVESSVAGCRL